MGLHERLQFRVQKDSYQSTAQVKNTCAKSRYSQKNRPKSGAIDEYFDISFTLRAKPEWVERRG